jgi:ABC-type Zn uptake system ZnuABC Zn-binding protein ZnuA
MRKHLFSLTIMLLAVLSISAQGVTEEVAASNASHPTSIVASTSWTAAFADLGGLDDVAFIAPASLTHPPEYEITVSDVVKINHADYFIYAGYERMMQSMGDSIKKEAGTMIQITTTNDIHNVQKQVLLALGRLLPNRSARSRRVAIRLSSTISTTLSQDP